MHNNLRIRDFYCGYSLNQKGTGSYDPQINTMSSEEQSKQLDGDQPSLRNSLYCDLVFENAVLTFIFHVEILESCSTAALYSVAL